MNNHEPSHITDHTQVCDTRMFPHIGQRIIKTTIAVYLCFLITAFRGRGGLDMTAEAAREQLLAILPGGSRREEMLRGYDEVRRRLGTPGAPARTADLIINRLAALSRHHRDASRNKNRTNRG